MWVFTVLLLPPGWDASTSQGNPQHYVTGTHLTPGWRVTMWGKGNNTTVEPRFLRSHCSSDLKSTAITTTQLSITPTLTC